MLSTLNTLKHLVISDRLIKKEYFQNYQKNANEGIEFLSQTLILLFLYLCILMSETLDMSNYQLF